MAGGGQENPAMPILDIVDSICHRCKKREREGKGKMFGHHYFLESMDFYVMSASKVELEVVRAAEPN